MGACHQQLCVYWRCQPYSSSTRSKVWVVSIIYHRLGYFIVSENHGSEVTTPVGMIKWGDHMG